MSFRDGCFGLFMTDRTQELRWTGANSRCCGFRQCNGCTGKSVYEMLRRVVVGKEKISMSIGGAHGGCSTCPTVARVEGEGKVSWSFFPATLPPYQTEWLFWPFKWRSHQCNMDRQITCRHVYNKFCREDDIIGLGTRHLSRYR